jgi:competence protein ComEC
MGDMNLRKAALILLLVCSLLISVGCIEENPGLESPVETQTPSPSGSEASGTAPQATVEQPIKDSSAETSIPDTKTAVSGNVTVHYIDVGQGDSILIQTPEKNILIDGGDRGNTALNYLKQKNIRSLDIVISTHPHADHIGGLVNVLQEIEVKEVIDPGIVHTTKTFEDYLNLIDRKDIQYTVGRAGMTRDLGAGAEMYILHPSSPTKSTPLNDVSVVTRITFGEVAFLFTGDAESTSEQEMLRRGAPLTSDILKVGHHGSRTSTSSSFLNAVNPSMAIIMCGSGNTYGHPHGETLTKLSDKGVDVYRTDLHGNVIITTDGTVYSVRTEKTAKSTTTSSTSYSSTTTPSSSTSSTGSSSSPSSDGKVNLNTASFEELQLIVHIGPDRAQQIIDLRPFKSVDQLTKVNGIGAGRLKDIKEQGIAYV